MAERLSILNATPSRIEGPSLLHQLVARDDDGDAIAIDYLGLDGVSKQVTYTDLHRRSDLLATRLRSILNAATTGNEHCIVPIYMPQCPALYISQLAVLKAGGAFCPLSLDVPEERLRFILSDVGARLLLTTEELEQSLPNLQDVEILPIGKSSVDAVEHTTLPNQILSSSPAYIMYTSGSTGLPKAVVISHSAATQALLAHERHIPSFSRFLQFASPTFDVSVFEIFFPLFRGRTLVSGDRRQLLSDLPNFVNRMKVDAAELTPSVASSLLQGRQSVPGLKVLLTIGEMLRQDVVAEFGGSDQTSSVLHGMYGPTEATIHCTLQVNFAKSMSVGCIGVPLDTVSAFIVSPADENGDTFPSIEILPVGDEGELAVGGHQLADGYLNRPEQTRSAFVDHPEYGRLYRTGDKARMNRDGYLECLGRISGGQVKLRGQVSLTEPEKYRALMLTFQ